MPKYIACLMAGALVLVLAAPAQAKIRTTRDSKAIANVFMKAKHLRSSAFDSDFIALPPEGKPIGHSDRKIAKFPRRGSQFAILSTGNARYASRKNNSSSTSFDNGGPLLRGTRDLVMMRVKFRVPSGKNCLRFGFKFLSEEFPEYVDSEYNDAFIAELDASTWDTPRGDPNVDYAERNFARDSAGRPISVNSVGDASVAPEFASGTTYDAATRTLRASTEITPGRHTLFLSIFDQGDRQFDSTVFIDKLRFVSDAECQTGVVIDE